MCSRTTRFFSKTTQHHQSPLQSFYSSVFSSHWLPYYSISCHTKKDSPLGIEFLQQRTQLINRCRCSSHFILRNTAATLVNLANRVVLLPSNQPDPRSPPLPPSFSEKVRRAFQSDSTYGNTNRTIRTQRVSSQTYRDKVHTSTYTDPYSTYRTYDRTNKSSSVSVPICRYVTFGPLFAALPFCRCSDICRVIHHNSSGVDLLHRVSALSSLHCTLFA